MRFTGKKKIAALCGLAAAAVASSVLLLSFFGGTGAQEEGVRLPGMIGDAPAASVMLLAAAQVPQREPAHLPADEALAGHQPREGFVLAPTMVDRRGVDPLSNFALRVPPGHGQPQISIDGEPAPRVAPSGADTFTVSPAVPLLPNSLYVFRLQADGGDVTWAFQTRHEFGIVSVLPRNASTLVPVRTSVEIAFTAGPPDISAHFSIHPHAEGRFVTEGSTVIFMPLEPLAHGELYTVTLAPGIVLLETGEILPQGVSFQFETAPAREPGVAERPGLINFSAAVVDFPSFEPPAVRFWPHTRDSAQIAMNVYRINDTAEAVRAANRLAEAPSWTRIAHEDRFVDTSGLDRIVSARHSVQRDSWRTEVFALDSPLPPGFYVLEATAGQARGQIILQITDIAVQVVSDGGQSLVWANDMNTGRPVAGGVAYHPFSRTEAAIGAEGVALIGASVGRGEYVTVEAPDGSFAVAFAHSANMQGGGRGGFAAPDFGWEVSVSDAGWDFPMPRVSIDANADYWSAAQLDRTLFQRRDTVNVWGFVQNRRQSEDITHVTATIAESAWWGRRFAHDLVAQNLPVSGGAFSGELRLPNLDPGTYQLTIRHGAAVLGTAFFTVDDYVTPPYRLTVSAESAAAFMWEELGFSARAEFFEGTPVSELEISYGFSAWGLNVPDWGRGRTDTDGNFELRFTPSLGATGGGWNGSEEPQGERHLSFNVEATLPEIGWVTQGASTRVFINDMHMTSRAFREDDATTATIEIEMRGIELGRLNDGTAAHWGDFLGAPVAGRAASVEVREIWWEQIRTGERFDSVRRQVVPTYRFERRESVVASFDMATDRDGRASAEFSVPGGFRERRSYVARVTAQDGNGRVVTSHAFVGRDWERFFWNAADGQPFLDGALEEGYDIGDEVRLYLMGGEEPLAQGNVLFVVVQGGIISYHVGQNPIAFEFGARHVPNVSVFAYHFNGHVYTSNWMMSESLRFNPRGAALSVAIETDRDDYRPGETASITLTVTDAEGRPVAANVNISLVDEALFALMENRTDTLGMLFRPVPSGLRASFATHATFVSDGINDMEDMEMEAAGDGMAMSPPAAPAPAPGLTTDNADGGRQALVRERFEDTAVFLSGRTGGDGRADFSFELPHNITTWRLTASAVAGDPAPATPETPAIARAGNAVSGVRVTQPMFLNYSLGSLFLVGDRPYVGVTAFGTGLAGSDDVLVEVWREDAPNEIRQARGRAFERLNIPLWEKTEEGEGAIVIYVTAGGHSDALRHPYRVAGSHRLVDVATLRDVAPGAVFDAPAGGGLTDITFMDAGRARFMDGLFSLAFLSWRSGMRVEGLVARREALRLMEEHFPERGRTGLSGEFDISDYQQVDGGISWLPYSESELRATVLVMPFVLDEVNRVALEAYLSRANGQDRVLALRGLAMLGAPVLMEAEALSAEPGISVRDAVYLGLAFLDLGERERADRLYDAFVAPHLQGVGRFYRINAGMESREMLEATTSAALLAARLGRHESVGLHEYALSQREPDMSMALERLAFIDHMLGSFSGEPASVTYTLGGETFTRELGAFRRFQLRIPSESLAGLQITETTGEVAAVSVLRVPLEEITPVEAAASVSRRFFAQGQRVPSTVFSQGDLVRVEITVTYSPRSVEGLYSVTDFLPAGLAHVPRSARFAPWDGAPRMRFAHVSVEGPRITFFDHSRRDERTATFFYYARVISPGEFLAEGAILQSVGAGEYMAVSEGARLTILP